MSRRVWILHYDPCRWFRWWQSLVCHLVTLSRAVQRPTGPLVTPSPHPVPVGRNGHSAIGAATLKLYNLFWHVIESGTRVIREWFCILNTKTHKHTHARACRQPGDLRYKQKLKKKKTNLLPLNYYNLFQFNLNVHALAHLWCDPDLLRARNMVLYGQLSGYFPLKCDTVHALNWRTCLCVVGVVVERLSTKSLGALIESGTEIFSWNSIRFHQTEYMCEYSTHISASMHNYIPL